MTQPDLFPDAPRTQTRAEWSETVAAFIPRHASIYGEVCADDIHTHCPPPPPDVDSRAIGTLLKNSGLRCIGYRKSARKESHFRPIGRFA